MTVGRSVRLVVCLRQLYLLFSVRGRVYFCIECIILLMCVFVLVVASFPRGVHVQSRPRSELRSGVCVLSSTTEVYGPGCGQDPSCL